MIAKDQAMVLGALAALLDIETDTSVVAQARDDRAALALAQQHRSDLALTDIEMPEISGLKLAAELNRLNPLARVVILTTLARPGYLRQAFEAGASGNLLKNSPSGQLTDAIRRVHDGGRAIDPEPAFETWTDQDPLSERERHVGRLAGEGQSGPAIAESLGLSEGTVRNYLSKVISTYGTHNRSEAGSIARSRGWQ